MTLLQLVQDLLGTGLSVPGWMGPSLVALLVTVAAFAVLWRVSLRTGDCSVVDLYWGFGFGVIAWINLALAGNWRTAPVVLACLVTVWSLRLGIHLAIRHSRATEEDPRYAEMRRRNGPGWERRSFWMVFMLQAVVMWLIALPLHLSLASPTVADDGLPPVAIAGIALFVAGMLVEALADAALARFKRDPRNAGRLLTTGLFAWSRHPNYFGETLLWWGLGLLALSIAGTPVVLVGPALLTLLLLKVSGIPPLEAHLSSRDGFADYVARTSPFLPLPPQAARGRTGDISEDGRT